MSGLPADFDPDDIARGAALFRQPCTFVTGAVRIDDLPPAGPVEVAFAGRSNVGKSSLVNALAGRKTLARISNTPGRTREINVFALGEALRLIDLPGYGYARAPKAQIRGWTRLIEDYLKGRAPLARVYLLIDARHGPKDGDRAVMTLMDRAAVSYQGVLTKIDKPKPAELEAVAQRTLAELARHPAAYPHLMATSARTGTGLAELRAAIAALAA